jgi:hypothetical protein
MLLRRLLLFLYTGTSSSPEELTKFLCATVNTRSFDSPPFKLEGPGGGGGAMSSHSQRWYAVDNYNLYMPDQIKIKWHVQVLRIVT